MCMLLNLFQSIKVFNSQGVILDLTLTSIERSVSKGKDFLISPDNHLPPLVTTVQLNLNKIKANSDQFYYNFCNANFMAMCTSLETINCDCLLHN